MTDKTTTYVASLAASTILWPLSMCI